MPKVWAVVYIEYIKYFSAQTFDIETSESSKNFGLCLGCAAPVLIFNLLSSS